MTTLIIIAGLPGVGKSYICKLMKNKINMYYFDSDKFAKNSELFKGIDYNKISKTELDNIRLKFYQTKIVAIEELFKKNKIVVMDAVFDKNRLRELFYEMIKKTNSDLIIIEVTSSDNIIRSRILNDKSKNIPGTTPESRLKVYELLKKDWQKIILTDSQKKYIKYFKLESNDVVEKEINKILMKEKLA